MTDEALAHLYALNDAGHTWQAIAEALGVHGTATNHWRNNGIPDDRRAAILALPLDRLPDPADCPAHDCTVDPEGLEWCPTHRLQLAKLTDALHGRHGTAAPAKAADMLATGDIPAVLAGRIAA